MGMHGNVIKYYQQVLKFIMFHRRTYSLDCQPENRAVVDVLLDCSNTLNINNSSKGLKREQESITPWLHLHRRPITQTKIGCTLVRTNRTFRMTHHSQKNKMKTQPRQRENKTLLATPKNRVILDEIQNYNYLSSNVMNLTRELQLIHHKKRNTYVSNYIRQQLYLKLKTN